MDTCIICSSDKNLNTQMYITINNKKIIVVLCDEHAEDTTVKVAKEKYLERRKQIESIMEQAKALGLNVSDSSLKPPTPTVDAPTVDAPTVDAHGDDSSVVNDSHINKNRGKAIVQDMNNEEVSEEGWISTNRYNNAEKSGYTSVGGSGAQSYSSYKVSGQEDILKEELLEGKVKMDVVEGRGGQPLPIPAKRIDGTGTTTIRIVNSENDQTLQRRFKDMAGQENTPDFRHGYNDATRTCPICRGDCYVNGKDCPKCKGSGLISIY